MSADLFAAFGDEPTVEQTPNKADNAPSFDTHQFRDHDDDFGDFEGATNDVVRSSFEPSSRYDTTQEQTASPRLSTASANLADGSEQTFKVRNLDVLFDAEEPDEALWQQAEDLDNQEEDDFGDFENASPVRTNNSLLQQKVRETTKPPKSVEAAFDLLGLDEVASGPAMTSKTIKETTPPTGIDLWDQGLTRNPRTAVHHTTAPTSQREAAQQPIAPKKLQEPIPPPKEELPESITEDAWDDLDETSAASMAHTSPHTDTAANTPPLTTLPTHILSNLTNPPPSSDTSGPITNIPPPSILLSHITTLLSTLHTSALIPLSTLPSSQKASTLLHPSTSTFLSSCLVLCTTYAHILSGRRQRWKRDKHLAQSMAIGPSTVGNRSGGMKLAGLDRSEVAREDQEAAESLRVWRAGFVGRLKSLISAHNTAVAAAAAASTNVKNLPPVPELAETMPVRVAKASEGAVMSVHGCALCGLKREERVGKVDVAVEDSFGEWWVQGANMHLGCWNFWHGQKAHLTSR